MNTADLQDRSKVMGKLHAKLDAPLRLTTYRQLKKIEKLLEEERFDVDCNICWSHLYPCSECNKRSEAYIDYVIDVEEEEPIEVDKFAECGDGNCSHL